MIILGLASNPTVQCVELTFFERVIAFVAALRCGNVGIVRSFEVLIFFSRVRGRARPPDGRSLQ
jgi:hypothetical protein